MALNKDDINLINKYFDKELSEKETEDFNKKLEQDSGFAEEVRLRREIDIQLHKADEYEKSKDLVYSLISEKQSVFKTSWTYVAIAASIAILIGVYILLKPAGNDAEDILITEETTDSSTFITPHYDELEYKADYELYKEFNIDSGQIIELDTSRLIQVEELHDSLNIIDTSQNTIYLSDIFIFKSNGEIDTLFYLSNDPIMDGKYIYVKDSIVNTIINWHLINKETTNNLWILTKNLRERK